MIKSDNYNLIKYETQKFWMQLNLKLKVETLLWNLVETLNLIKSEILNTTPF